MHSNYRNFKIIEELAGTALPTAIVLFMYIYSRISSRKRFQEAQEGFLNSYEDDLLLLDLELTNEEMGFLDRNLLKKTSIRGRFKLRAFTEDNIVLVNNRKFYNYIKNNLRKFPMFKNMHQKGQTKFTIDEFISKHEALFSIFGSKFNRYFQSEDPKIVNNAYWIREVLNVLTNEEARKYIKTVTVIYQPPKVTYNYDANE